MSILFVTGTGTDVGKTVATAALASALRSQYPYPETGSDGSADTSQMSALGTIHIVKPIQTGEPEGQGDVHRIERLTGLRHIHTLLRYPEPLAPATAARRAGMDDADLEYIAQEIEEISQDGLAIVEGAGGLLVRMGRTWTIADLAMRLGAPVAIVCSTGLGSLNEAELTVEAALRRNLSIAGLIGGRFPENPDLATECNREDLPTVTGQRVLGYIPDGAGSWSQQKFVEACPDFFDAGALDHVRQFLSQ